MSSRNGRGGEGDAGNAGDRPSLTGEASFRAQGDEAAEPLLDLQRVAGMDHEMRTLSGGVVHMSERLLGTHLDAEQQGLARRLRATGAALLGVLDDLRALGELEAGFTRARADFDLRRTVEEAGELLALEGQERGVEIVSAIPPELPGGVRGDVARLRHALLKLGAFGIESLSGGGFAGEARPGAAPAGDVVIRAELVGETAGGVVARFEVTYEPAPAARQPRASHDDRAEREERDPFAPGLGSAGLSVALAKRLIEALGGHLQTASDPRGGGLLWFELAFERRGRSTTRGLVPRIDLGGKRALIIDDSAAVRAAAREMIELLAMECDASATAEEGLRALRAAAVLGARYDVVLVDAALAGGDAALARIRAEAQNAGGRVLPMAYPRGPTRTESGVRTHDDGTLAKPLRMAPLHATLRALLAAAPEELRPVGRASSPAPHRSGAFQAIRAERDSQPGPPPVSRRPAARPHEAPPRPEPPAAEPDAVAQVIDLLVTAAPKVVTRMRAATVNGAMDDLGRLARDLHEQASALSLMRLSDLCARLEREARAGTLEAAADAVRAIEQEVDRSRISLSADAARTRGQR